MEVQSCYRVLRLPLIREPPKRMEPPSVVITADESDSQLQQEEIQISRRSAFPQGQKISEVVHESGRSAGYGSFKKVNGCVAGLSRVAVPGRDASSERSRSASLCESTTGDAMLGAETCDSSRQQTHIIAQSNRSCFNDQRRKILSGIFLTAVITMSWAGGTHFLKAMEVDYAQAIAANKMLNFSSSLHTANSIEESAAPVHPLYHAPFFTAWFCTAFNTLFYPVYITSRLCVPASEKPSFKKELLHSIQPFQEKGISVGRFVCHCSVFTIFWVISNYLFIKSLSLLDATDVISLYAVSVVFVYLLSWVVLEEQFVGIRIVAVIVCNTGIALFAYMDGQSRSATLGGVVMAATASAGTAVQKVVFKKFIGEVNFAQVSLFFTCVGIFNLLLLWPFFLTLYLTGLEVIQWAYLPWLPLVCAALFIFLANILGTFGIMWTYSVFLTLGLVFAIPVSAIVDNHLYSVTFKGMKLAGMILIIWGFFLVLLPDNWPDYLTAVLRWRRTKFISESQNENRPTCASRLRTHSGRVK